MCLQTLSKKIAQDYILEVNQESHIILTVDQSIFLPRAPSSSEPREIFINSALSTLPQATEALS